MNPSPFTVEELRYLLRLIVDAQTSHAPEQWKPENPFRGHCIVVSLIVQDFFGGDLLCASLQGLRFEGSVILAGCHCWNHLPDGAEVDLTIEQFGEAKLDFPPPEHGPATRSARALHGVGAVGRAEAHRRAHALSGAAASGRFGGRAEGSATGRGSQEGHSAG